MIGLQVERELQIDQRQILAAAAGQRGADAVQRLGRAGLRQIRPAAAASCRPWCRAALPAPADAAAASCRTLRKCRPPPRHPCCATTSAHRRRTRAASNRRACRRARTARRHPCPCPNLEDHAGVEILEDRIPFRAGQLVDTCNRRLGIARAVARPTRQQRRHQVGNRPADRLVDVELRGGIFLLLEVTHADDQPRNAVRLVHRQDAIGKLDRFIDVAIGQRRDKGAVQEFVVLGIGAQRRAIECRGGSGVALDAGVARGQIAAGRRQRFQVGLTGELRGVIARVFGRLGQNRSRCGQCGESDCGEGPTIHTNGKHHGSPSSRMYGGIVTISLECKPKRRHLGQRQCRFWPSTARIGVGESIGRLGS